MLTILWEPRAGGHLPGWDDTKQGEWSQAMRTRVWKLILAAIVLVAAASSLAEAGEPGGLFYGLTAPVRALHRKKPPSCPDDAVERLAAEIDWLEAHIKAHGSIVAKQPDVWGQNRLTRARQEYEEQMRAQLGP